MGFITHFVIKGKILLQDACGATWWDDKLLTAVQTFAQTEFKIKPIMSGATKPEMQTGMFPILRDCSRKFGIELVAIYKKDKILMELFKIRVVEREWINQKPLNEFLYKICKTYYLMKYLQ
jgi:hypothetical protein